MLGGFVTICLQRVRVTIERICCNAALAYHYAWNMDLEDYPFVYEILDGNVNSRK